MPAEFSTGQPPIKIPSAVPVEKLDPERKKLYEGLTDVDTPLAEPPDKTPAEPPLRNPPPLEPDLEDHYYQPTEEDKQTFARALLGGRSFEKRFILFGAIEAQFVDRLTEQTEQLFAQLEADTRSEKIKTDSDEAWSAWAERYNLASTLRQFKDQNGMKSFPVTDKLLDRVQELMKQPKPLYQALMQAGRRFEAIVNTLTAKAHDQDFWKTGGASSHSKPTSAVR